MTTSPLAFTLCALSIALAAPASSATATDTTPALAALMAAKVRKNGFTPLPSKKSGSGVAMAYRIEGTPTVGSPLTIRITMASSADSQVTLRAEEGLTLSNPNQVLTALAGVPAEHTVIVVPLAEGRFYLNLFSLAAGRGSASSVAVQVGKGAAQLKPEGTVQVLPSGERVISVPAQ
jgi:hypothetical protein